MNSSLVPGLLCVTLGLCGSAAWAESADRNQPINVEADSLRYDELKQTSVFSGRVVLTKGSIVMRGDRVDVRQDPQGYQYGVITGAPDKLAFFRQKRDGLDEFIEGESETIEYDSRSDTVKFAKQAQMRRLRGATLSDELIGSVILYNNSTNVFSVDGTVAPSGAGAGGTRVRAMLSPKPAPASSAPAPAASANPTLRISTTLGGEKK